MQMFPHPPSLPLSWHQEVCQVTYNQPATLVKLTLPALVNHHLKPDSVAGTAVFCSSCLLGWACELPSSSLLTNICYASPASTSHTAHHQQAPYQLHTAKSDSSSIKFQNFQIALNRAHKGYDIFKDVAYVGYVGYISQQKFMISPLYSVPIACAHRYGTSPALSCPRVSLAHILFQALSLAQQQTIGARENC